MRVAQRQALDHRANQTIPIAVVVLVSLAILGGGEVRPGMAAMSTSKPKVGLPHQCACGMGCRDACCCMPRESAPRRTPASDDSKPLVDDQSEPPAGPCLASAPCGQPGAPNSEPTLAGAKSAITGGSAASQAPRLPDGLVPESPDRASSILPEPPEKPPKPTAST